MMFLRACVKSDEERRELAKKLSGAWVCPDILATQFSNRGSVPVIVSSLVYSLGYERVYEAPAIKVWRNFDANVTTGSMIHIGRSVSTIRTLFASGKPRVDLLKFNSVIQNGIPGNPVKAMCIVSNKIEQLREAEQVILAHLINRSENHMFLPQLVRSIRGSHLRGTINLSSIVKVAEELGAKFACAALRLAERGFKSKRFKFVKPKIGDSVRRYYDGFALSDVVSYSTSSMGKIAALNDAASIVVLSDGSSYKMSEDCCQVIQMRVKHAAV